MQSEFPQNKRADILIEVVRRIGKRREDDDFSIARVDGMRLLFPNQRQKRLQLGVMLRGDVPHKLRQQLQIFGVLFQLMQP